MESITCLKVFPSEKSKVFHEVYRHGKRKMNYLYIRHHFDLPNPNSHTKSKKIYYFYDQSVIAPIAKTYFAIP